MKLTELLVGAEKYLRDWGANVAILGIDATKQSLSGDLRAIDAGITISKVGFEIFVTLVKETPIVGSIISAGSFYNNFFKIGESIKRGDNPKDADILGAMGDVVGVRGVFFWEF